MRAASLRRLYRYFRPYRLELTPVVLGCLLEMAFNAQIPLSVRYLIDEGVGRHDPGAITRVLTALAAVAVLVTLGGFLRDYFYARVTSSLVAELRAAMFRKLQQLSQDYFQRTHGGDILSRFSNDLACAEVGLSAGVAWGLQPALDIVMSLALIAFLDWRLAVAGFVLAPLALIGPQAFGARTEQASERKQAFESKLFSLVQENVAAAAVVRAYGVHQALIAQFTGRNQEVRAAARRVGLLRSIMQRTTDFSIILLQLAAIGIGGALALHDMISVGTFVSFQTLFMTMSYSAMWLSQYAPTLAAANGGLNRIEHLLKEEPRVRDAPSARSITSFERGVEFKDVCFRYSEAETALENLSLSIPRGGSVALVGPSGSGKSTILNLLLRFHDPTSGTITIDGIDYRDVTQASLRNLIAVVFQENLLFDATVKENIRLGRPEATDDDVEAAARAAGVHDFIRSLPEGYATLCGERGGRFSGGQRQRIAIARALLRNPAILILDEATSALDPASEALVQTSLDRASSGRTVISITHRLRSVTGMDRIFVLDRGRLAEAGTHAELMARNGLYARLWRKQQGVRFEPESGEARVDVGLLAQIPALARFDRAALAALERNFTTEIFEDRRDLIRQGEPADRLFVVVEGCAELSVRDGVAPARLVGRVEEGDFLNETALLGEEPSRVTATAVGPCVCVTLPGERFKAFIGAEA